MAWFDDLASARQMGHAEPAALSWADTQAWAQLMGYSPEPWQVAVLRHLDALWLNAWRTGRPKQRNQNAPREVD